GLDRPVEAEGDGGEVVPVARCAARRVRRQGPGGDGHRSEPVVGPAGRQRLPAGGGHARSASRSAVGATSPDHVVVGPPTTASPGGSACLLAGDGPSSGRGPARAGARRASTPRAR